MKTTHTLFSNLLLAILICISTLVKAQTPGPSDATTPPPTNASDVDKVLCYGQGISLSGPKETPTTDYAVYHWYKEDVNGVKQLITGSTGRTYTETTGAAGYYKYYVVTENANGCISPVSDVLKIFVLPALSATVTAPVASMCADAANAVLLTANVTPSTGYTINYQWTRNGTNINGATASTYNATGETSVATVTFGVNVSYALNTSCTATGTKDITITPVPTKPMITAN